MTRAWIAFIVCTLFLVPTVAQAHSDMDLGTRSKLPAFLLAGATERVEIVAEVAAFDPAAAVVVTVDTDAQFTAFNASQLWRCTRETKRVRCTADELAPGSHTFTVDVATPASGSVRISTLIASIASSDLDSSNNQDIKTGQVYAAASCGAQAPALISATPVPLATSIEMVWSPSAGASFHEVYASIDGETPHLVATTSASRATLRLIGGGEVSWFVRARFEQCPSIDSATASFTSFNPPARLAVRSIVSPMLVAPVAVTFDRDAVLIADGGARKLLTVVDGIPGVYDEVVSGDVVATPLAADGGIAVGPGRYLYIADRANDLVRYAYPFHPRPVFTVAGRVDTPGSTDAVGTAARVNAPFAVTVDDGSRVYIADSGNHTIRRGIFDPPKGEFAITTFAGSAGQTGTADAQGTAARFNDPAGMTVDADGNLLVADRGNHTIRRITSSGVVSTIAGVAGEPGHRDGAASQALFNRPTGVAFDEWGNLLVTEEGNHTIRKIAPNGRVTTVAGQPGVPGAADGVGPTALFNRPALLGVDANGTIWIPDAGNGSLRRAEYFVTGPKRRSAR